MMVMGWKIHYGDNTGWIQLGPTEFKRRALDTTPSSKVICANEVAVAECDSRIPSSLLPFDMVRGRPVRATEFKRRSLDTTPSSKVICANEVVSSLLSAGAPASQKDLSKKTQRFVDRTVARVMAVDSVQNQKDSDDLRIKTNKKSEMAEVTNKITNGERSSGFVRHPMASKEIVK